MSGVNCWIARIELNGLKTTASDPDDNYILRSAAILPNELLPVSSSAHLNVIPWIFDWTKNPQFVEEFGSSFNGNSYLGQASQVALIVKNSPANAEDTRDLVSIPRLERCSGGGNGNPL